MRGRSVQIPKPTNADSDRFERLVPDTPRMQTRPAAALPLETLRKKPAKQARA